VSSHSALRHRQHGVVARWLLWGLAALIALAAALLAALTWGPNLMREQIAARTSLMLGRTVHVDHISISPFAGHAVFSNLVIDSLEPGKPMLTAKRVDLKVDSLAFLHGVVVVRSIDMAEPRARIVRTSSGALDLSDVIAQFTNRPASLRRTDWRVDRVALHDGAFAFDDQVVKKVTRIDGLQFSLEGLTNLEAKIDQPATLKARFTLDDRPAALDARATLFSEAPAYDAKASLDALPLASVLPYVALPADIRPTGGAIDLDLISRYLTRPERPEQALRLEGRASLKNLGVADAQGAPRLSLRNLSSDIGPSFPLGGEIRIAALALAGLNFSGGRTADGSMTWPKAGASSSAPAPARPTSPAQAAAAPNSSSPSLSGPRSLRIERVTVEDAAIQWADAALPGGLEAKADPVTLTGGPILIPDLSQPSRLNGTAQLQTSINGETPLGIALELNGTQGQARVDLKRVPLARYAPLAGPALKAKVERGFIEAQGLVRWNTESGAWSVDDTQASLTDLRITHPRTQPLSTTGLKLSAIKVDGAAHRIEIGQARLERTNLSAFRDAGGLIDLQQWYEAGPSRKAAVRPGVTPPADPAWSLLVRQAEVDRLELDYRDALIAKGNRLPRVTFSGKARDLTLDPKRTAPFEATVSLADGSRLSAAGTVRPQPLNLNAQLRLQQIDLTYLDPYIEPYLNLALVRGQLWGGGRLNLESLPNGSLSRIGFAGEVSANNVAAEDKLTREDFARWSALAAPSVNVDWRPGRPVQSSIAIGDVAFVDFYARVILSQEGRLNLSNILADPSRGQVPQSLTDSSGARTSPPPSAAAPTNTEPTVPSIGSGQRSATVNPRADTKPAERPRVSIGTIRIASGNVVFTDLFIRPNYTANLTQLSGSIDALASDRTEPSDVLISGRVDDDTPLDITGKINPLAPRNYIDLRAVARGFDLPKLSPYSGRWAGYAIEKGKLTANVRYKVEGDKLDAENKLVINQLTFGEKVESRDALKLPVQLAVSLLKDANGNIDLDLPISGTLSDPQFSVGGLIWRAIGNLIVKVVTSPFRFLASLGNDGGTGTDLSQIEFSAGDARIDDEDRRRLDGLATALEARPALSLDIIGYADPKSDAQALQQARLERALQGTKLGDIRRTNKATELTLETITIDATERAALIERLWRAAKLDGSAQGKAVSPQDMEQQLLERNEVATEDMRQLAQRRAETVRNYLREERKVPTERLYVLAPRVSADSAKQDTETASVVRKVTFEVK
jgi:outer membrane protein OmpA-like peptidoglycan-associated protein